MGKHQYGTNFQVTVGQHSQRKTNFYHHDSREDCGYVTGRSGGRGGGRGGGNFRGRRGGDRRVSFNDGKRGGINKRGGRGGPRSNRFDDNKAAAILGDIDEEMGGRDHGQSQQSGRARPAMRSLRSKYRIGRTGRGSIDRNRFVSIAPLGEENILKVQQAMNNRYNVERKALNLENFGSDPVFAGGTFNGHLFEERVMTCVVDIIGKHLTDLEAVDLSGNQLYTLLPFSKVVEKAQNVKILYLEKNKLRTTRELDHLKGWKLLDLKLDGNPMLAKFKDGQTYLSIVRKKFPTLKILDGKELPKLITFEDDEAGPSHASGLPALPQSEVKMVANDQVGDFIGKFIEQFFRVYDSDRREDLAMAYHEEAVMTMSTAYHADGPRAEHHNKLDEYVYRSRNLLRVNDSARRQRLVHSGRLSIVAFINELPKTRHDLTSFTLDVPFATERLVTFTVTGIFRESGGADAKSFPIRHFNRMFVVVPQGEGLCIVNETLYITVPTKKQSEASTTIFTLSDRTGMNTQWSKMCLTESSWNLDQAAQAFQTAQQEGKIPAEAFNK